MMTESLTLVAIESPNRLSNLMTGLAVTTLKDIVLYHFFLPPAANSPLKNPNVFQ